MRYKKNENDMRTDMRRTAITPVIYVANTVFI